MECKECNGSGTIPDVFPHPVVGLEVANRARCFLCWGSGETREEVKQNTTAANAE